MNRLLVNPEYNFFRRDFWFGRINSRPLSVFRVGISLFLLKEALYHIVLAHIFYSDGGVTPRLTLYEGNLIRPQHFSLMEALSADWMVVLFFILWTVVVLCLLFGYRTRLMSVLNFIIILSVHERNVFVLTSGDTILRMLCFWMMFIPLDHYYAIDAIRRRWARYRQTRQLRDLRVPYAGYTAYAFPVRMIMIQVALVYLFTSLLKLQGNQWQDGQAVGYVFQIQALMVPLGRWFWSVAPDWVFRALTYQTLITELGFTIFMFAPFLQPSLRLVGLVMSVGLHLGIGLMMTQPLPDFSFVMFTSYLLFLEGDWYAILDDALRATRQRSKMQLPADANSPGWLLMAVTSGTEITVETADETFTEINSDSRTLLGHLPLTRPLSFLLGFAPVRAAARFVGRLITRSSPPQLPLPSEPEDSEMQKLPRPRSQLAATIALTLALAGIMISMIWWNIDTVIVQGKTGNATMPQPLSDAMLYTGIWQYWNMFAPRPLQQDGWIVIPGHFEDGTTMDVRTRQPFTTDLPVPLWGPEMRWQKYDENLNINRSNAMLLAMGRYYCNQYDNVQALPVGKRLMTLEIHYLYTPSHPPGAPPNTQLDDVLWMHQCYP